MPEQSISDLLNELEGRMQRDFLRMRRWRLFHRLVGVCFSFVVVVIPAALVAGLLSSERLSGKICLLLATIIGGINAIFRPFYHSFQRRSDMNESRHLLDSFRSAIIRAKDDPKALLDAYDQYSAKFCGMYASRGSELVDAPAKKDGECHLELEKRWPA